MIMMMIIIIMYEQENVTVLCNQSVHTDIDIDTVIFVNCNWVATRWQ